MSWLNDAENKRRKVEAEKNAQEQSLESELQAKKILCDQLKEYGMGLIHDIAKNWGGVSGKDVLNVRELKTQGLFGKKKTRRYQVVDVDTSLFHDWIYGYRCWTYLWEGYQCTYSDLDNGDTSFHNNSEGKSFCVVLYIGIPKQNGQVNFGVFKGRPDVGSYTTRDFWGGEKYHYILCPRYGNVPSIGTRVTGLEDGKVKIKETITAAWSKDQFTIYSAE